MATELKDIRQEYQDDARVLFGLREKHARATRMYTGLQWADVKPKPKPNRPSDVINFYRKHVDVVYGYLLANRTDLKVYPVEGSDDTSCDIRSRVLQWILSDRNYYPNLCLGAQDAYIGGLGWVFIDRRFDTDIINGDVVIENVTFQEVLFDPYTKSTDLSDCDRIYRRKYVHKDVAKMLWPDMAAELEKLAGKKERNFVTAMDRGMGREEKNRVNIIEKWYAVPKMKIHVVNTEDQTTRILDTDDVERAVTEAQRIFEPEELEKLQFLPRRTRVINLLIQAEDEVILYEGPHPDGIDRYPFIPVFGYYTPSAENWAQKVQGAAEVINDLQMEINKIHSSILYKLRTKNLDGYSVRRGANVNMKAFLEGDAQQIDVDAHDDIQQLQQAEMPIALFEMMKIYPGLITQISHNPDFLGDSSQRENESGVTLGLRQRQAMTIIQQLMVNWTMAYRMTGNYINDIISKHFTQPKIERILGEDTPYQKELEAAREQIKTLQQQEPKTDEEVSALMQQAQPVIAQAQKLAQDIAKMWDEFEDSRYGTRYDCRVGEVESTPTHRMAMVALFEKLMHQGKMIPDDIFIEYLEMPRDLKEKWLSISQSQQQGAQEMQQAQQQFQMELEKLKGEIGMMKQQLVNQGQLQLEMVRQAGEKDRSEKEEKKKEE